jgi:hypothetical protein
LARRVVAVGRAVAAELRHAEPPTRRVVAVVEPLDHGRPTVELRHAGDPPVGVVDRGGRRPVGRPLPRFAARRVVPEGGPFEARVDETRHPADRVADVGRPAVVRIDQPPPPPQRIAQPLQGRTLRRDQRHDLIRRIVGAGVPPDRRGEHHRVPDRVIRPRLPRPGRLDARERATGGVVGPGGPDAARIDPSRALTGEVVPEGGAGPERLDLADLAPGGIIGERQPVAARIGDGDAATGGIVTSATQLRSLATSTACIPHVFMTHGYHEESAFDTVLYPG